MVLPSDYRTIRPLASEAVPFKFKEATRQVKPLPPFVALFPAFHGSNGKNRIVCQSETALDWRQHLIERLTRWTRLRASTDASAEPDCQR